MYMFISVSKWVSFWRPSPTCSPNTHTQHQGRRVGLSVAAGVVGTRDTADFWERVYFWTTMKKGKERGQQAQGRKSEYFLWYGGLGCDVLG